MGGVVLEMDALQCAVTTLCTADRDRLRRVLGLEVAAERKAMQ